MVSRVPISTRAEKAVFNVLLTASSACRTYGLPAMLESLFFPQEFFDQFAIGPGEIEDIFADLEFRGRILTWQIDGPYGPYRTFRILAE